MQLDAVTFHEIAHHGLRAFSGEFAIVSVVAAQIGKALQLKDRAGAAVRAWAQGAEADTLRQNAQPNAQPVWYFARP